MKIPKHWSYTASFTFKCPRKFKRTYIQGIRQVQGPSAIRGERIHQLAEWYLKGEITGGVPGALKKLEGEFKTLRRLDPVVEKFWGVDSDWHFVRGKGWCVMKMDAAVLPTWKVPVLDMIDLKTGREYDSHEEQGELYVAIGFARDSWIEEAGTEFWYADQGYVIRREYTRQEIKILVEKWKERGQQIMTTRKFPAVPSVEQCMWCHVRSDKGGDCDRWKEVLPSSQ